MEKRQPGVMLYFDIRPCLTRLTMDEQGQLFRAILDYGEDGTEPNFDYMLGIAWDFIKPRLERDRERYAERIRQCEEAARKRWEQHSDADACERMPTTTASPTVTPNSTSLSKPVTTPPGFVQQTGDFVQRIVENLPKTADFP